MTRRLATIVATGATVLGAMGLTAPAATAATTPTAPDYFLGTTSTVDNLGGWGGSVQGTC